MITNTFASYGNTIIKNSRENMGKDPIIELFYGEKKFSRHLIYFDLSSIEQYQGRHILRLTNTSTFDTRTNTKLYKGKNRASSFILNLYRLSQPFVGGNGYDLKGVGSEIGSFIYSSEPSNYYDAEVNKPWSNEGAITNQFSTQTFKIIKNPDYIPSSCKDPDETYPESTNNEYLIYSSTDLIARQKFTQYGENIEMDITDYVIACNTGLIKDYGFCLCFDSDLETSDSEMQYVGFFGTHSNNMYSPYIQTSPDEMGINDTRNRVYLDNPSRLYYFNRTINGLENLATPPSVIITQDPDDFSEGNVIAEFSGCTEDETYKVHNPSKGIYYIDFILTSEELDLNGCSMLYDIWKINRRVGNGNKHMSIEQSFTLNNYDESKFDEIYNPQSVTYLVRGLSKGTILHDLTELKFEITPRLKYTYNQTKEGVNIKIRLYAKEGNNEIEVMPFTMLNYSQGLFWDTIKGSSFKANRYYMDLLIVDYSGEQLDYIKEFLYFDKKYTKSNINFRHNGLTKN